MVYRNNPVNIEDISLSSGTIQTNFADYYTTFNVNHVAIDDATDPGKHFQLDIPNSILSSNLSDDEVRIANASSSYITNKYITTLYRLITGGSTENLDMTEGVIEDTTGFFIHTSGSIIKWGIIPVSFVATTTDYTLTLPVASSIPAFSTAPFVLPLLLATSAASLSLKSATTTSFIVNSSSATDFSVLYIAIGT